MRKIKIMILLGLLLISTVACSSKNNQNEQSLEDTTSNPINEKKEREFLITKYFELEKGVSYNDALSILNNSDIEINDPGEFDAEAWYRKREVSISDKNNKLDLVFRDNKLGSKTFTYDTDNTNSTWFYSNYYDILDAKDTSEEDHGIWVNAIKCTNFTDEYEINIYLQDNNF